VRVFEDPSVIHVANKIDPLGDIGVINLELIFSDMEVLSKRLLNLVKDVKRGDKEAVLEEAILRKIEKALEAGKMASEVELTEEEKFKIKSLNFLTLKPMLYVLNTSEANTNVEFKVPGAFVKIDSVFEKGFDDLITGSYKLLGLETFFTTGEDESRAWTIKIGSSAPVAGSAIHTDFKDKFIRAEVIAWDKLLEAGSYAKARENGWVRTEGKEYVVQDGDVVEFLI
jgi:ribosome-binding ATPase YchF (GTP1/OBG family)